MTYNFYKMVLAKLGMNKDLQEVLASILIMIFWFYAIISFGLGAKLANNDKHCRVHSIGDVLTSPFYALGCNIGKDRFDQKLN
jgi:hypothetical protein